MRQPRFTGSWDYVTPKWREAYRLMTEAMERRGIATEQRPPIWCWLWNAGNRTEVIQALCSDGQIDEGIAVVELDVPNELAFLSCYTPWNVILDRVSDGLEVSSDLMERLLRIDLIEEGDQLQACLPYVELDWIRGVRKLGRSDFEG